MLVEMLTAEGYRVEGATDGEAALTAIERTAPDLVLLDVGLPGIDGFEVCRRIKQRPATRLTPVVLGTGLNERDHRIAGIHAGADDFLTKPINVEELQARVASHLRLKRYTDELDSADSVILSLAMTVEARDAYTDGHCQRLARYATALGRAVGPTPMVFGTTTSRCWRKSSASWTPTTPSPQHGHTDPHGRPRTRTLSSGTMPR